MNSKLLTIVAVLAIAFAAFNLIITMDKVGKLTGYAGEYGNASLEVSTVLDVYFVTVDSRDLVDWGQGSVVSSGQLGWLYTNGTSNINTNGFDEWGNKGLPLAQLSQTETAFPDPT